MAQAEEQAARFLVTEDADTMGRYWDRLRADGKVSFRVIQLEDGFDVARVNRDGQRDLGLA